MATMIALAALACCVAPSSSFILSTSLPSPSYSRPSSRCSSPRYSSFSQSRALLAVRMAGDKGEEVKAPESVAGMMQEVAAAIRAGSRDGLKRMLVEVPLPITGGTELDDWPGGIGQKYQTMRAMLGETMRELGFDREEMEAKDFVGIVDDAIGLWRSSGGLAICCFPTPEVVGELEKISESSSSLVLVNPQFFLDQFSAERTKEFLQSFEVVYLLQSLNMKGTGLLPVKGMLRRSYPEEFVVARRIEKGKNVVLQRCPSRPAYNEMQETFVKDSETRDSKLSLFERLAKFKDEATNF